MELWKICSGDMSLMFLKTDRPVQSKKILALWWKWPPACLFYPDQTIQQAATPKFPLWCLRQLGLNFDRVGRNNSDINYDPSICRNIMVDISVLFIIDKYASQNLISELNLVHLRAKSKNESKISLKYKVSELYRVVYNFETLLLYGCSEYLIFRILFKRSVTWAAGSFPDLLLFQADFVKSPSVPLHGNIGSEIGIHLLSWKLIISRKTSFQ